MALVVAAALGLSACSGAGTPAGATTAPDDAAGIDAQLEAWVALDPDAQLALAATLDQQLGRLVREVGGFDDALGGADAADAAFAAHGAALVAAASAAAADVPVLPDGGPGSVRGGGARNAGAGPSVGEGLFGGLMTIILVSSAAVEATNTQSPTGSERLGETGTISGDTGFVEMTQEFTHTSNGIASRLVVKVEVVPCPDPDGRFEARSSLDVTASTLDGSAVASGTLDVVVNGQLDADARLATSDVEFDMTQGTDNSDGSTLATVSGAYGDGVDTRLAVGAGRGAKAAEVGAALRTLALVFALMIKDRLLDAAAKGWESGRCVALEPTASPGPQHLDPSSTSTLTAAPRSRLDGGAAGGTVTATLSGGGTSVAPGGKIPADATFTFTAPDEVNQTGTVDFEARSRRGVGRASLTLDTETAGWAATGGGPGVTVSGLVSDLTKPFTLQGAGDGFTVTFSYTPASATAGSVTYAGSGSGFELYGDGPYTITGDEGGPLTLTQTTTGCVKGAGCATNDEVITLTPVW